MGNTKLSAKERYVVWSRKKPGLERLVNGRLSEIELIEKMKNSSGKDAEQAYEDLISLNLGMAAAGDKYAAEYVLGEFCRKAQNRESVPTSLSWWIGVAIEKMLNGVDAKKAFHLSAGTRGRPKKGTVLRDMNLFDTALRKRAEGKTFEDAVNETAEEQAVSESTVKRAYESFRNTA